MAIDTTPENLMAEIEDMISHRRREFSDWDDLVSQLKGPDRNAPANKRSKENAVFRHVARRVPQQAMDLPMVRCDSPRMDLIEDVQNFERGLSRWMSQSNLRQVSEQTAYDFNLREACILVRRRECEEYGEVEFPIRGEEDVRKAVPYWPTMVRISPKLVFKDARGSNPYDFRMAGRPVVADKEDLLEKCEDYPEQGWIRSAIEQMTEDAGLDKAGRKQGNSPTRNEVVYYEVWVGDAKIDWKTECLDDDGKPLPKEKRYLYNGKIFYIAVTYPQQTYSGKKKSSAWIRKPQPYFGPPEGPYVFFGEHTIPEQPDFAATLTANHGTIKLLDQATESVNRGIRTRKSLTFVNDVSEGLEQKIADAPDQTVHTVPGLESSMVVNSESGGVTTQMIDATNILRDRLDRDLGEDDAARGKADPNASATAVALAARSAGSLNDRAQAQFVSGIRRALRIVGFYIWYDEEFAVPIGLDEAVAMGDPVTDYVEYDDSGAPVKADQPMVYGGTEKQHSYASLELTIEPYSMERMGPEVASLRADMMLADTAAMSQILLTNPGIRGNVLVKAVAKYRRIPELEYVFDFVTMTKMLQSQAFAQAAQVMDQPQAQPSGDQASASTPKVASFMSKGSAGPRAGPQGGGAAPQAPKMAKPGGFEGRTQGGKAGESARKTAKAGAA